MATADSLRDPAFVPVELQESQREGVVHILSQAFAADRITMDQLDERLAAVYRARSVAELQLLLADPSDPSISLSQQVAPRFTAAPEVVPSRGVAMAFMGGFERKGQWVMPRHMKVTAIMGGGEFDLREARLSPGITELEVFALMGGVEIIIPDGVRVDVVGMAFMGGFSTSGSSHTEDPNAPVLRVSGTALMGGVEIKRRDRNKTNEKRFKEALKRAERARKRN